MTWEPPDASRCSRGAEDRGGALHPGRAPAGRATGPAAALGERGASNSEATRVFHHGGPTGHGYVWSTCKKTIVFFLIAGYMSLPEGSYIIVCFYG